MSFVTLFEWWRVSGCQGYTGVTDTKKHITLVFVRWVRHLSSAGQRKDSPLTETLSALLCCFLFSDIALNFLTWKRQKILCSSGLHIQIAKIPNPSSSTPSSLETSIVWRSFALFASFAYWSLIGCYILWRHKQDSMRFPWDCFLFYASSCTLGLIFLMRSVI